MKKMSEKTKIINEIYNIQKAIQDALHAGTCEVDSLQRLAKDNELDWSEIDIKALDIIEYLNERLFKLITKLAKLENGNNLDQRESK